MNGLAFGEEEGEQLPEAFRTAFWASKSSVSWCTPPEVVDAAKELFGGRIDRDPCPPTNPARYFAEVNETLPMFDALRSDWNVAGKVGPTTVLLNPPFGTSYVKDGVCISAKEFGDLVKGKAVLPGPGDFRPEDWRRQQTYDFAFRFVEVCCEGVWISKAAMETHAIQFLLRNSDAVCFPDHRINYLNPDTGKVGDSQATFSSLLFYVGEHVNRFLSIFRNSLGESFAL